MTDEGFFEPVEGKLWSSTFNHQKRTDTSRVGAVIPKDRLVIKKGRYFTTDTSSAQLQKNLTKAGAVPAEKPAKKFVSKNA